ncbi:hypothetical protein SDC9_27479 [bioreactor metagenome]|uniref:DUF218 domain-containing protein n=1 Tax=bioreactor metagenome TaxID=1076179 RepID=A0A644URN7_9ZZZZ|nr:YdcF family protein [Negativicutes bacterium]
MTFGRNLKKYILGLILLSIIVIEIPIIAVGQLSKPEPGDAIIVLGAKLIGNQPSTMLRLRLDEANKLYHQGYATTIIVSGAQGPDEETSEALAMQAYLVRQGIPPEKILIEDKSFNTFENLYNCRAIMLEEGLESAIIVSNASHIRRSLVLARNLGIKATGAPAPMADNTYLTAKQYAREGAAMLSLLILNR